MKILILINVILLLNLNSFINCYCIYGKNLEVKLQRAACLYIPLNNYELNCDPGNICILNATGTTDNLYGYVSISISSSKETPGDLQYVSCKPRENAAQSCKVTLSNRIFSTPGIAYYIACLECHYWLGSCNFDYYDLCVPDYDPNYATQQPQWSTDFPCKNCH
eukprot:TRINITY_DN3402_c1_g1_i1.p1 TRINITY_DN3402_c1_g1~~TRINITY_DN3402_c1_g1_i1.p1  ORF type:complete len:164 (-),score=58.82 TRINITY_DN3402_c1_g1_i1:336-827(-)